MYLTYLCDTFKASLTGKRQIQIKSILQQKEGELLTRLLSKYYFKCTQTSPQVFS